MAMKFLSIENVITNIRQHPIKHLSSTKLKFMLIKWLYYTVLKKPRKAVYKNILLKAQNISVRFFVMPSEEKMVRCCPLAF